MNICRKVITAIITICIAGLVGLIPASANSVPYENYTYDKDRNALPGPAAYVPRQRIDHRDMGLDAALNDPLDFCYSSNGYLYIADTGNNRIVQLDESFQYVAQFSDVSMTDADFEKLHLQQTIGDEAKIAAREEELRRLNNPTGVTVDNNNNLYIADTNNNRIIKLDDSMRQLAIYPLNPEDSPLLSSVTISTEDGTGSSAGTTNFVYLPIKIAVDSNGRMFVTSRGVNQGLMEFTSEGKFVGFLGAPKVTYNTFEIIRRYFMTKEQIARMPTIVPTEFSNVTVDSEGFLYATISTIGSGQVYVAYSDDTATWSSQTPVMRFNATGKDILVRTGIVPPIGDFLHNNTDGVSGPSRMTDAAVTDNGVYSLLDIVRNRVFTYDADGNLMYVFGGSGTQVGLFSSPSAVEYVGNDIAVLDRGSEASTGSLTVFSSTEYGDAMVNAIALFNQGMYDESVAQWESVLRMNSNYQPAYVGIGKNYLRNSQYEEAIHYLSIAEEMTYQSKAYGYYRDSVLYENTAWIFVVLGVVAAAVVLLWVRMRKRARAGVEIEKYPANLRGNLRFSFFVIFHPFKGYWDLKKYRDKKAIPCVIFVAALILSLIINSLYRGVFLSPIKQHSYNIVSDIITVLLPLALWCISTWCFTSMMDGKATLGDIFAATCYALVPLILVYIPLTVISNFLTLDELAIYHVIMTIASIWTILLIVSGLMITNDYSVSKTIITCILSIIGVAIILFIGLVAYSVVQQVAGFIMTLYREITFRL